jgi:hypothetical protein
LLQWHSITDTHKFQNQLLYLDTRKIKSETLHMTNPLTRVTRTSTTAWYQVTSLQRIVLHITQTFKCPVSIKDLRKLLIIISETNYSCGNWINATNVTQKWQKKLSEVQWIESGGVPVRGIQRWKTWPLKMWNLCSDELHVTQKTWMPLLCLSSERIWFYQKQMQFKTSS